MTPTLYQGFLLQYWLYHRFLSVIKLFGITSLGTDVLTSKVASDYLTNKWNDYRQFNENGFYRLNEQTMFNIYFTQKT